MNAKLWAPGHPNGCHLGLTNGTTFVAPHDKAGAEVPHMFRRAAIARGCVPVGTEPKETEANISGRAVTLRRAIERTRGAAQAADSPTHQPAGASTTDPAPLARPEAASKTAAADHAVGASLDDRLADELMRCLERAGAGGLSRTQIRDVFGRHLSTGRIGAALDLLRAKGRVTCESFATGGRPVQMWRSTP